MAPLHLVIDTARVPDTALAQLAAARAQGQDVTVELRVPETLTAEARDGWEIGVLTMVLPHGVHLVTGASAQRVRRVQAVLDQLAGAAS